MNEVCSQQRFGDTHLLIRALLFTALFISQLTSPTLYLYLLLYTSLYFSPLIYTAYFYSLLKSTSLYWSLLLYTIIYYCYKQHFTILYCLILHFDDRLCHLLFFTLERNYQFENMSPEGGGDCIEGIYFPKFKLQYQVLGSNLNTLNPGLLLPSGATVFLAYKKPFSRL